MRSRTTVGEAGPEFVLPASWGLSLRAATIALAATTSKPVRCRYCRAPLRRDVCRVCGAPDRGAS